MEPLLVFSALMVVIVIAGTMLSYCESDTPFEDATDKPLDWRIRAAICIHERMYRIPAGYEFPSTGKPANPTDALIHSEAKRIEQLQRAMT